MTAIDRLNDKVFRGEGVEQHKTLQCNALYGYNNTDSVFKSLKIDDNGKLETSATISTAGIATSANQTNGNQKCQILGNTVKDGTGTSYHALMDADGKLIVDGSSVTQPISASSLPLPAGASTASLQSTGNGHLSTIAGDTTSMDGKITQGNDATLTTAQQVGVYAHNGTTWKQIHSTSGGNVKVSLEELNGSATGQQLMAASIPVVIASDQTAVATTNTKITSGEGNIAGGGSGLQQVLIYGKDQSGNLDPIDIDSQGHLKVTIQDEEKALSSTNLYSGVSLTANTPSTAQAMNDKKNIQIVGKTTTATAKIGLSFQSSGTDYYTNPEYASLYHNGVDYEFSMTVQGVGANSFKIYPQTNASDVYLTYHLF